MWIFIFFFCKSKGLGDEANAGWFLRIKKEKRLLPEVVRRDRLIQGDVLRKEAKKIRSFLRSSDLNGKKNQHPNNRLAYSLFHCYKTFF